MNQDGVVAEEANAVDGPRPGQPPVPLIEPSVDPAPPAPPMDPAVGKIPPVPPVDPVVGKGMPIPPAVPAVGKAPPVEHVAGKGLPFSNPCGWLSPSTPHLTWQSRRG